MRAKSFKLAIKSSY